MPIERETLIDALTAELGGTRLQVTETGVEDLDWPQERKDEYVADHNRGWAQNLDSLGEYLSSRPER